MKNLKVIMNRDHYLKIYEGLIAFSDSGFSTDAHAPGFVEDWIEERLESGDIKSVNDKLTFSAEYEQ